MTKKTEKIPVVGKTNKPANTLTKILADINAKNTTPANKDNRMGGYNYTIIPSLYRHDDDDKDDESGDSDSGGAGDE